MLKKLLVILLLGALLCIAGCAPGEHTTTEPIYYIQPYPLPETTTTAPQPYQGNALGPVQWNLAATKVDSTGKFLNDGFIFTVEGEFREENEHFMRLDIEISFEDYLPYIISTLDGGYDADKTIFQQHGYYSASATCIAKNSGMDYLMHFAIDPIKGFAIFYLKGDYYLGSVDSFVDPADIYAHFHAFVETHRAN